MPINIIERAIIPRNTSSNQVVTKARYHLYIPAADVNRPGLAGYSPDYFIVRDQIVELNPKFYNTFLQLEETDNLPEERVSLSPNKLYRGISATVVTSREPDGEPIYASMTGSMLVFEFYNDRTDMFISEGNTWLRRTTFDDDGILLYQSNFEPVGGEFVTDMKLAYNAVQTHNIRDGSVTEEKLDKGAVSREKLTIELQEYLLDVEKNKIMGVVYDGTTDTLSIRRQFGEPFETKLALGAIIAGSSYNADTRSIILTFANNQTITIPLDDFTDYLREALDVGFSVVDGQLNMTYEEET